MHITWGCLRVDGFMFLCFLRKPEEQEVYGGKKMNAKAKRLLSLALSTLMVSSTVSFAIPASAEPAMGEGSTDSF